MPSERSTAYLLFRLWAAEVVPDGVGEIVVMPFDEIMPAVRDGQVDAGLVIHEARFTYRNYGLHSLADMGEHWESTTGLPIPLGAIIAKRSLGEETLRGCRTSIRTSVRMAWDDPERSRPYVLEHAQEMDPAVADQHIGLYVNEFTADLGEDGYAAVRGLLTRAAAEGLVPPLARDAFSVTGRFEAGGRAARARPAVRRRAGRRPPGACRRSSRRAPCRGSGRAPACGVMFSSSVVRSCTIEASSSGLRRCAAATDGAGSRSVTESAWSPRWPATTPNSTRWPGLSASTPAGSTDECTKTSPPSSRERKPKPFSLLNHLTLPVGTSVLVLVLVVPGAVREGWCARTAKTAPDSTTAGRKTRQPPRLMVQGPVTRRRRVFLSRWELPWSGA